MGRKKRIDHLSNIKQKDRQMFYNSNYTNNNFVFVMVNNNKSDLRVVTIAEYEEIAEDFAIKILEKFDNYKRLRVFAKCATKLYPHLFYTIGQKTSKPCIKMLFA